MNDVSEGGWSVLVGASNEDDLIAKARTGDSTSFVALVQTHDAYLRRVAFNLLGNANHMDDVLQQTYLSAFESLRAEADESPFGDWLFSQAFADCEKARTEDQPTDDPTDDETQTALDDMTAQEVAALSMVAGENISPERAATLFDVSKSNMSKTLASARKSLTSADATIFERRTPRHDGDFWTTIHRSFAAVSAAEAQAASDSDAANPAKAGSRRRWLRRSSTTVLTMAATCLIVVVALTVSLLGKL